MVTSSRPEVDDAVRLRPEDMRLLLPVVHSSSACAGAATGYLVRRIAYRAGAYAPGLQEELFHEVTTPFAGRSLDAVQSWFVSRQGDLHNLGYRLHARRVVEKTPVVLEWVGAGKGLRGAVLSTSYRHLHPQSRDDLNHAVGIAVDRLDPAAAEELMLVDPWPGFTNGARDRSKVPPALEAANRAAGYHALVFYWSGWS